jgi:hypothetical protein
MRYPVISFCVMLLCSVAWGQAASQSSGNAATTSGMPAHDMSNMKDMPMSADQDSNEAAHVMHSMEGHMDMGPHMKMTELRKLQSGDSERAQKVADEARQAAARYTDYHVALADGFRIFHPEIPQKIYHFTNYSYGFEAAFAFNPEHPTSLLYEKHGDDYKLVGVMYTAPKRFTEDELNDRIPLSIAQWHEHVNFCKPPAGKEQEMLGAHPEFGLRGSITTQQACDAAGGTFRPVIFNWMVHVYPFEKDQASMWSVDRQHGDTD